MHPNRIRKSWHLAAVAVLTASILSIRTEAQRTITPRTGQRRSATTRQATSPLATVHQTFENAARIMESALPIYDGHRHRAIELAKLSAREIREAATGATGKINSGTTGQHKTAAQRAALIPKGANVALSKYTSAQIAQSNTQMQKGLQLLQQGLQQLQTLGQDPGNHMSDAAEFGNMAIQAANKGLQFVAGK